MLGGVPHGAANSYRKVGLVRTSAIIISRPYMTTNAPVADDAAASGKPRARGSSPGRIADPSAPRTTAPEFLARLPSAAARRFAPSTRFLQLTNLGHPVGSAAAPDRPRVVRRTQRRAPCGYSARIDAPRQSRGGTARAYSSISAPNGPDRPG